MDWLQTLPDGGITCLAGLVTALLAAVGVWRSLRDCQLAVGWNPLGYGVLAGLLGGLFVWLSQQGFQSTPEVVPDPDWKPLRVVFHLSLIVLLVMITATDLKSFSVLVWTCWLGVALGLTGAVLSGDFQLAHVWVDWNQEVPQIRGPAMPAWLASHPHLHGLAWSSAGIVVGTLLMWLTRWISSAILGLTTLGSGDVYLMAMIGAYLGWQPTVVVVLLAPLLAILVGVVIRLAGSQAPLPYGPFLALGAVFTLFFWRPIWMAEFALADSHQFDRAATFAVRRFFGDPWSMLIVAGLSLGLMLLLLGLLRIYKSFPVKTSRT
ncbi:prepilin peptidase [Planctomicrobium sp. SH664]|uniref:prepilin peptidase n=1 Tax=Planctomicrobium sp. SH664 TaxID=3448125 RepID=UPI003F5ADEE9